MTDPTPDVVFEVTASDGRVVRLMRKRYETHIIVDHGHSDLVCDFLYPEQRIAEALQRAERIEPYSTTSVTYFGPWVQPDGLRASFWGKPSLRQLRVGVWLEPEKRGHVVTAYSFKAKPKR